MLLCPWKKPRKAEIRQMNSTAGPSIAMANHALSSVATMLDRGLAKNTISAEPRIPSVRNTRRAVEKILRI